MRIACSCGCPHLDDFTDTAPVVTEHLKSSCIIAGVWSDGDIEVEADPYVQVITFQSVQQLL